jgi:two-component system, NtrC family, C4-dicarboxylate transport sensor histidine kinase DctB
MLCDPDGVYGRFSRMAKTGPGLPPRDAAGVPGQEELITLNRSATVARLVAGVFHELNNALQVIGGLAELLQDLPGIPPPVADGLRRIHLQNAKAGVAIAEMMAFSRQKTDVRGRVNMRDVTTRAVGLRTFAIGRARLTLVYEPSKTGVVDVQGFANLLLQAVLNLIVNAEQALAGQPGGTIRVELEWPAGWVLVRVSDNGPGIDPAVADRLFEPFVTTRSREESSGLGLAVAKQIAESHGGTLMLESASAGASFALRLPSAT